MTPPPHRFPPIPFQCSESLNEEAAEPPAEPDPEEQQQVRGRGGEVVCSFASHRRRHSTRCRASCGVHAVVSCHRRKADRDSRDGPPVWGKPKKRWGVKASRWGKSESSFSSPRPLRCRRRRRRRRRRRLRCPSRHLGWRSRTHRQCLQGGKPPGSRAQARGSGERSAARGLRRRWPLQLATAPGGGKRVCHHRTIHRTTIAVSC